MAIEGTTDRYDFVNPYVNDLKNIIDLDLVRSSGLRLAVDPLNIVFDRKGFCQRKQFLPKSNNLRDFSGG